MVTEYASEIHQLLKLGDVNAEHVHVEDLPVALPIVTQEQSHEEPLDTNFVNSWNSIGKTASHLRRWLVYPLIFMAAFAVFYVALNFSSIISQVQGYFVKPQAQEVLGDSTMAYYKWIQNYYYAVNDEKLLDPNNDIDKDGLSNMDEFIMRTNPTIADSDSDRYSDGTEVINGYNPWGNGVLTVNQKELAAALNFSMVNDRISYGTAVNRGLVAGIEKSNYDLNKPGILSIPRLNLQVPLIWSKDAASFEADLSQGVIHYPGTAMPGEQGTIYVSGHSSDYVWKKDPMSTVFAKINYLQPGDDVFVAVYGVDGKTYNYRYQVTGQKIYAPDDQTQFIDNSTSKLNLSTCWPIGTQKNRIVVSAVQIGL
jgi:LPXTG-site transpeptidase (sortase) family protein